MALQKLYQRINWENYPSEATPLNESNLNKMDAAVYGLDDRVISLDTTKLNLTDAQGLIKNVAFDSATGIFTFTYYNGSTLTVDTLLEKIVTNWDYDEDLQQLVITTEDGAVKYVDLSALITQYEFDDTDTVAFSVNNSSSSLAKYTDITLQNGGFYLINFNPSFYAPFNAVKIGAVATDDGSTPNIVMAVNGTEWEIASGSTVKLGSDYAYGASIENKGSAATISDIECLSVGDGHVSAIVKEGSIEEKHLQPNYLANVKVEVARAQSASAAAAASEEAAAASEANAKASEEAAAQSAAAAAASAAESGAYADDAHDTLENVVNTINETVELNIPNVWIDTGTGELMWEGGRFDLDIDDNADNGTFCDLMWEVA